MNDVRVEVAYAGGPEPERQAVIALVVPAGITVAEAIRRSGILVQFPEIGPVNCPAGVFGVPVTPDRVVNEGERVEVYRALVADPKEARRRKAKSPVGVKSKT